MKPTAQEREVLVAQLARARVRAGVSMAAIARGAGVSASCVLYMESGRIAMSAPVLEAYAALCDLSARELLLAWCIVPIEVLARLRENPALCELVLEG